MKVVLTPESTAAIKKAAAIARTYAIRPEDTAAYIEARKNGELYIMVKSEQGVTYEHTMNANVSAAGSVAVSGKILHGIIGRFNTPTLSIVRNDKFLRIAENGSHVDLPIYNFTLTAPERSCSVRISLPASTLLTAINDVKFAVMDSSFRNSSKNVMLSTMNVVVNNGIAMFEGCTGQMCGKIAVKVNCDNCTVAIPHELLVCASAVLSENKNADAGICYNPRTISIECNGIIVTSPRLAGKYLDTNAMYNTAAYANELLLPIADMKEFVARALAITTNSDVATTVRFTIPAVGGDNLIKAEYTATMGELTADIPCTVLKNAQPVYISFNPRLLSAVLNGLQEEVNLFFDNSSKPILLMAAFEKNTVEFEQSKLLAPCLDRRNVTTTASA